MRATYNPSDDPAYWEMLEREHLQRFPGEASSHSADSAPRAGEVSTSQVPGFEGLRAASLAEVADPMMDRVRLWAEFPDAGAEPTGMVEVDSYLRLGPGHLTIVGGREGAGKSALMLQWARAMSHRGPVVYLLTEMTLEEVVTRLVASTAHVEAWKIERGARADLMEKVQQTLAWLAETSQLCIVEAQGVTVSDMVERVRKFAAARGQIRAVFVDNLWGVALASRAGESRGGMSFALGGIAQDLRNLSLPTKSGGVNAPVIVAHHLNREAAPGQQAKNSGGVGTENLGGSDQIGFWASHVTTITRCPSTLDPFASEEPDAFTFAIHKNRNGRPNIQIPLKFHGAQQRFEDSKGTARPLSIPVEIDVTRDNEYRSRLAELPEL